MTEIEEIRVNIAEVALGLSFANQETEVEKLINNWTHTRIIRDVCATELSAISRIRKSNFKLPDHQYYTLYRDYPNFKDIEENFKLGILQLQREFEYVLDDPTMLMSISPAGLVIFRNILSGFLDEGVWETNLPKDPSKLQVVLQHMAETWALLHHIENARGNVTTTKGDSIDFILDNTDFMLLTDNEVKEVVSQLSKQLQV